MAEQAETRRSIETPQQSQIRLKRIAEQAAIRRSIETPQQTQIRLRNMAEQAASSSLTADVALSPHFAIPALTETKVY